MAKKLLISTLGTSPSVVTEALDLLKEEGVTVNGVVLLSTADADVRDAIALLSEHLPSHDGISRVETIVIESCGDVVDAAGAVSFMQEACRVLKQYRDDYQLYVSIAGGRKVMSALLALAVQFYGASRLFHVWVPPWLENEGDIERFRLYRGHPEKLNQLFHPSLEVEQSDRPRLVDLPFVSLFPLLPQLLLGLRGEQADKTTQLLLATNQLIDSHGRPTQLGDMVRQVLEDVESLPPPRSVSPLIDVKDHHYKEQAKAEADKLCNRFTFVVEATSIPWREGESQVKSEPPDSLRVYFRTRQGFCLALRLRTTAATPGQLEAARKDIERYVRSR